MSDTDKHTDPLKNAIEKVRFGDWIYFTMRSDVTYPYGFGDLYKARPDGTELTLLQYGKYDSLKIKGGQLCFIEYLDNDCYEGYTVEYVEQHHCIPLDDL